MKKNSPKVNFKKMYKYKMHLITIELTLLQNPLASSDLIIVITE